MRFRGRCVSGSKPGPPRSSRELGLGLTRGPVFVKRFCAFRDSTKKEEDFRPVRKAQRQLQLSGVFRDSRDPPAAH